MPIFIIIKYLYHLLFLNYLLSKLYALCPKYLFRKKNSYKYFVSVCAIFKDEARYLVEWIEFNKIAGIEHFYLYNNNSSDDYRQILDAYIKKGIATLVDFPGKGQQINAYKHCIENYNQQTQWIAFIDCDEFFVPTKNQNALINLLKKFSYYPALAIQWRMFGSGGHTSDNFEELLTEKYILSENYLNHHPKTIFNMLFADCKADISCHWVETKIFNIWIQPIRENYSFAMNFRHIWKFKSTFIHKILFKLDRMLIDFNSNNYTCELHHYWSKSWQSWKNKINKGLADKLTDEKRSSEMIFINDQNIATPNYNAYRYLLQLKKALGIID